MYRLTTGIHFREKDKGKNADSLGLKPDFGKHEYKEGQHKKRSGTTKYLKERNGTGEKRRNKPWKTEKELKLSSFTLVSL